MVNESVFAAAQAADTLTDSLFYAIVEPILIIAVGAVVARLGSLIVYKTTRGASWANLPGGVQKRFSPATLLSGAVTAGVYIASFALVMIRLDLFLSAVKASLVLASLLVLVAASLKVGDFLIDVTASRDFDVDMGERVEAGHVSGTVIATEWLGAKVRDDGRVLYVPYRYFS